MPYGKYRRRTAARAARSAARCDIDGLAKMPLQASIFASWYNLLGILPTAKSKRLCRARAFARLRNSTAEQKCPCKQAFLLRGLIANQIFVCKYPAMPPVLHKVAHDMTLTAEQKCPCKHTALRFNCGYTGICQYRLKLPVGHSDRRDANLLY